MSGGVSAPPDATIVQLDPLVPWGDDMKETAPGQTPDAANVFLVGAGPGDPDLLTVKALRLIQSAEVVVYDRLVGPDILDLIPVGASRIFAGKAAGAHHLPQEEINQTLVRLGRSGRRTVRLKGGDPFVFGRGSEEALELVAAGIPFEVVPGISAATGASAYAGIPLTHRGLARSVRFVTGHCREDKPLDLNWQSLADADTTLVIYMGLANLKEISAKLIEHGLAASTPAAAIENGTKPGQRRLVSTLADLPADVKSREFQAPCLLVIGRVVELAGALDWFAGARPSGAELDNVLVAAQ